MNALFRVTSLLIFGACGVLCQRDPCSADNVERCTQNLKSLYKSQDGPVIVKNEAELLDLCRHQQSALNCINQYVDTCLSPEHRNIFNNLTIGVQDFVNDFCTEDSNTRRVYVRHLDCFNRKANQVQRCTDNLHEWNKRLERAQAPRDQIIPQSCCRYEAAMNCIRNVIRNGCQREAADLFDGLIEKVSKQFHQISNCGQYSYVVADCTGGMAGLRSSLFSICFGSVIALLFSVFRKFW